MRLTNFEMLRMADSLEPLLPLRDVAGYAAARNTRLLGCELMEFENMRESLVQELGEEQDGGGWAIAPESPNFPQFLETMNALGALEHDFEPYRIAPGEVIGKLSGQEILAIDWMLKDGA